MEYVLSKIFPAVFSENCILSYKKLSFSISNKVSSGLILKLRERFPSGCLLHEPLGLSCSVPNWKWFLSLFLENCFLLRISLAISGYTTWISNDTQRKWTNKACGKTVCAEKQIYLRYLFTSTWNFTESAINLKINSSLIALSVIIPMFHSCV